MRERVLKVTKESLLFMKGQENRNLYMLQGHTVVGVTAVSNSEKDTENILL